MTPRRFGSILALLLLACSSASEDRPTGREPGYDHAIEPEGTPKEFPCYDDTRIRDYRRAQRKKGRSFDEKDLAVLASLYQQVGVEDLLEGYDRHNLINEIVITLSSQDTQNVLPTEAFVASISTDSLTALLPDTSNADFYECELRLWAWLNADSAFVEATLKHSQSRIVEYIIGRGGLVVSDGQHWTVCPWWRKYALY